MKTNYHPRSRRSGKARSAGIIVVLFILGLIVLGLLRGPLITLISPLWKGRNFVSSSISNSTDYLRTKSSLIKENDELKEKLDSYESLIIAARSISKKNEELMSLVGRAEESGAILGGVVSRPPQTPYDVLIIDAGTAQGIEKDMRVSTKEGYALGIVSEASARSSKVALYTLPGEKTDAVMERDMTAVILEGAGGGNFKVALPRNMVVAVGDRILIAGTSGKLVAVVGDVSLKPTDSFKEVVAHSPVNLSRLTSVFVSR